MIMKCLPTESDTDDLSYPQISNCLEEKLASDKPLSHLVTLSNYL